MAPWDKAYTKKMRKVFETYPDDLEVRVVFAESIMNETPWKMWDLRSGKAAEGAGTEECRAVLEYAFDKIPASWRHPGLLHLYVHLMEMSPFPQRALRAGDRLREIVPDAGHLIHMPTHIDILCGHYHDVLVYNQKALVSDRRFLAYSDDPGVYLLYVVHNFHFAIYGAMFLGQYSSAIAAAKELIATVPEAALRIESPPMADFLEPSCLHAVPPVRRLSPGRQNKPCGLSRDGRRGRLHPFPSERCVACVSTVHTEARPHPSRERSEGVEVRGGGGG
jgi:hypothetical protein